MSDSTHGVMRTYRAGCRCADCKAANAAATRKYRAHLDSADRCSQGYVHPGGIGVTPCEVNHTIRRTDCMVEGCEEGHGSRGFCPAHAEHHRRGKSVEQMKPIVRMTVQERFMAKVENLPSGHWMWMAATASEGRYGAVQYEGRVRPAHVAAWLMFRGPIPEGWDVDHLCRTTLCVNPDHLEPKTHRANVLAGDSIMAHHARQTHCKRGHEFNEQNTRIMPSGGRYCRPCARLRYAARRAGGAS